MWVRLQACWCKGLSCWVVDKPNTVWDPAWTFNSTFCSWQHRFRDSRIISNSRSRLQNKSGRVDADSRGNENRGSNVRLRIPRSKLANVDTDHRKLLKVIAMYRYEWKSGRRRIHIPLLVGRNGSEFVQQINISYTPHPRIEYRRKGIIAAMDKMPQRTTIAAEFWEQKYVRRNTFKRTAELLCRIHENMSTHDGWQFVVVCQTFNGSNLDLKNDCRGIAVYKPRMVRENSPGECWWLVVAFDIERVHIPCRCSSQGCKCTHEVKRMKLTRGKLRACERKSHILLDN